MNIGERINELRKKNNMTQEQLAELLCVSPQAISKWERGVANPDLYLIPTIASTFNVSSDLLLGIDAMSDTNSRIERLERQLEAMTAAERKAPRETKPREIRKNTIFDFKKMSDEDKKKWRTECAEIIDIKESVRFKSKAVERIVRNAVDPYLMISNIEVDLKDALHLVVRLRTVGNTRKSHHASVLRYKENPEWDELKSFKQNYHNGNMMDVVVPCINMGNVNISKVNAKLNMRSVKDPLGVMMTFKDSLFCGTLIGLRIDPMCQGEGYCEIESVMLVKSSGEVSFCMDFSKRATGKARIASCIMLQDAIQKPPTHLMFSGRHKGPVFDPQLIRDGLSLDISRARQVHVRVRGELANKHKRGWCNNNAFFNANLQVFFTTEASPYWSPQKCVTAPYVSGEGWFELYLDMSKNIYWCGVLTGIRIDPENEDGVFEVELVEIIEMPEKSGSQTANASVRELEEKVEDLENRLEELHCSYEELYSQYEDLESKVEELESELKK